MSVAAQTTPP